MTLKELYDLVPVVAAENMYEIDKALNYAQELLQAATDTKHQEGAREVIALVLKRQEQIQKLIRGAQSTIQQIAVFAHVGQDFEPKV